jgi:hypothetical protein
MLSQSMIGSKVILITTADSLPSLLANRFVS